MADRNPSPTKFTASTAIKISIPAGTQRQGWLDKTVNDCALAKIFPQLAVGGITPTPKKESDASVIMDVEIPKVILTKIGDVTFGNICLNKILDVEYPEATAA